MLPLIVVCSEHTSWGNCKRCIYRWRWISLPCHIFYTWVECIQCVQYYMYGSNFIHSISYSKNTFSRRKSLVERSLNITPGSCKCPGNVLELHYHMRVRTMMGSNIHVFSRRERDEIKTWRHQWESAEEETRSYCVDKGLVSSDKA